MDPEGKLLGAVYECCPPAGRALATPGQRAVDANGSQEGELLSSLVRAANEAGYSRCLEISILAGPGEVLPTLRERNSLTLENRKLDSQELGSNSLHHIPHMSGFCISVS